MNAIRMGEQLLIKPTKQQSGGLLPVLLAGIGVPLLMNALPRKGLQVNRRGSRGRTVYVAQPSPPPPPKKKSAGLIVPWKQPQPYFGTWQNPIGMRAKKGPKRGKAGY